MMQECGYKPLSSVVDISAKPHASTNMERDHTIDGYIPNSSAVRAIDMFSASLGSGAAMSIIGPYGSGKSTFGVLLNCLAAPNNDPGWNTAYTILRKTTPDIASKLLDRRRRAGIHDAGMIRCIATARLEPVVATILRAAANGAVSYFGASYNRSHFSEAGTLRKCIKSLQKEIMPNAATISKILASMAGVAPILLAIDEFGKNIEYFAIDGRDGDLFVLQDLAEMTGTRGARLHIVTIQHMSFGEYVAGTPAARTKEWSKIQGRFAVIRFANSLDHTRALLAGLLNHNMNHRVNEWADQCANNVSTDAGVSIRAETIAPCYPLHPLAVESLPELCSRYGQNDRTLLSFVCGGGPGTVARFIERSSYCDSGVLPTMGLDHMYDYFVVGSAHTQGAANSRLVEIDMMIRDSQLTNDTEIKVLKTIGVLNLVGRSGMMCASMGVIQSIVGNDAKRAVKNLEAKSIITYRAYADEYRIWHGTDVDIAAKTYACKKAILNMPHPDIMKAAIKPDPIVAAKHGMHTGAMRIFNCTFESDDDMGEYDGCMIYGTPQTNVPESDRPILVAKRDVCKLTNAAADVAALRAVLSDEDVASDRVACGEVLERLAAAEQTLEMEFDQTYDGVVWSCVMRGDTHEFRGSASAAASDACSVSYPNTPTIRNETINRNHLTTQGSTALNKLMRAMMCNEHTPLLGISGWGPERAIYEAVLHEHDMHGIGGFSNPKSGPMRAVWFATLAMMRKTRKPIQLTDIYHAWRMPPYGIKNGVMPILILHLMLVKRSNVAVYEHGSYVPRMSPSVAERMVKNPQYFSLKYNRESKSHTDMIEKTAKSLGIEPNTGMLGVVGHLVGVVRALPAYTKKTKHLTKSTLAVRNAIQTATEPDTLMFESIPKVFGADSTPNAKVANGVKRAVVELQGAFDSMMCGMVKHLLDHTNTPDRQSLAIAASKILHDASDQPMRVFLGAVSADIPDEKSWISYVGLTLTDTPPADWSDIDVEMFGNKLREVSASFRRLAALRFASVSDSFGEPSAMVTITMPDGSEKQTILPVGDERLHGFS